MRANLSAHFRRQFVGYVALFVALGGVSYAAVTLPRNSVGAGEIKANAVRAAEIRKNAVASSEAKNNALKGVDIDEATLATVPRAQIAEASYTKDESDARFGGNQVLSAVIGTGATVNRGRRVVSASRLNNNEDLVVFDRDVSACTYVATVGGQNAFFEGPSLIQATNRGGAPNTVDVRTTNTAGTATDLPFHLIVVC